MADRRAGDRVRGPMFVGGIFLGSRIDSSDPIRSSAPERLTPVDRRPATSRGGTVYVPVYSSMYLGLDRGRQTVELTATVSVRNTSRSHPILIDWVCYYDSTGKEIRNYLTTPASLPPLGSVEFVVQRSDTTGGPGANFLVQWGGPADVDEPLIEAVMLGESKSAGISFTSAGRSLRSEAETQSR